VRVPVWDAEMGHSPGFGIRYVVLQKCVASRSKAIAPLLSLMLGWRLSDWAAEECKGPVCISRYVSLMRTGRLPDCALRIRMCVGAGEMAVHPCAICDYY